MSIRQPDKRILSASHCQTDTGIASAFSDRRTRRPWTPPQTAESIRQSQRMGDGRKAQARKRPDTQTKGCGSSSIRTDAGTLPRPPTSRPGSPDRPTGSASGGPAARPVSLLAGGNSSPARLTRSRRRRREPQTDKGQRTDRRARWRRATPGCAGAGTGATAGTGRARQAPGGHGSPAELRGRLFVT